MNATLKRGGYLKRKTRLRPISKKKSAKNKMQRAWICKVYREFLDFDQWPNLDGPVPCMATGKLLAWKDLVFEHVQSCQKFPELKDDPHNWGLTSKEFNRSKGSNELADYREPKLLAWISICVLRDWTKIINRYYRD